jgi:cytochrome c oxidase subunit 6b
VKGEGYEPCKYFYHVYRDICPAEWVEKWNEQREKGIFPAKI